MKKYLISAAAALALGGVLSSCTHDEMTTSAASQDILEKYADVFTTAFGTPAPTQSWGFAESSNTTANTRGLTRGADKNLPTNPTFSDKDDISKPIIPSKPTTTKTFYNTVKEAKAAKIDIKHTNNKVESNGIYSINRNCKLDNPQNFGNLTFYIDDDMTFSWGLNDNGNTFVITEDKTVTLSNLKKKFIIYVAPGATLNLSDGATLQEGSIYLNSNSTLNAGNLTLQNNGEIINNGGTINIGLEASPKSLTLENSSTLWNEGTVNIYQNLSTSNDYGIIYNANGKTINAKNLTLNKYVKLWNEGTLALSGNFESTNEGQIIYNSGTISGVTNLMIKNNDTTLWNEGSIDISNNLDISNVRVNIYNGVNKTISAASLTLYSSYELIVNDGTLSISGAITLSNEASEIVNNGTLSGASLEMKAGAMMYNTDITTITGKTHIANSNCKWKNEGQYTTGDFEISDYAEQVYNNCKLIVHKADNTGEFKIYGKFVLDGNASVITDTFNWINNSYFFLKGKSLLKVLGTFLTQNYDINGGLYGCGNEYAVVQAGSITHNGNEQYRMSYYGNLYIATDSHFSQWYKDTGKNQPCYYYDNTVKFGFDDAVDPNVKKSACPVTIPYNERCNPGFEGGGGGSDPDPDVVRIIAEDLTWGTENGDFDFNDVVFDVRLSEDKQTITITLKAAGGTLPLRIAGEYEVHDKFGVPTGTIVNTGTSLSTTASEVTWSFENLDKRNYQLINGQEVYRTYGSTVKEVAYNLPVEVQKLVNGSKSWVELTAPVGKAAAKLAVDNTYDWCDERQSVDEKYYDTARSRGKFSMYVKKENPYAEDNSWYK